MSPSGQKREIEIRGRVVDYRPHALMDDFAGGGHQSFDAATLEVLAPPRLRGSRLTIYQDPAAAADSPWRQVGAVLAFTLDEGLLAEGVQVFSGAAGNLRRVP